MNEVTKGQREKVERFSELAAAVGLSHPVGRAASLVNRMVNGSNAGVRCRYSPRQETIDKLVAAGYGATHAFDIEVMMGMSEKTAVEWEVQFQLNINLVKKFRLAQRPDLNTVVE